MLLLTIFLAFTVGPRIRTEGHNSSSRQIAGGSFLMPYCLGLLLPFPLWQKSSAARGRFNFFLGINLYIDGRFRVNKYC